MQSIGDFIVNSESQEIFSLVVEFIYGKLIEFKRPIDEMRLLSRSFKYGIDRLLSVKVRDYNYNLIAIPGKPIILDIDISQVIDDDFWSNLISDDALRSVRHIRIKAPRVNSFPDFINLETILWNVKNPGSLNNLDVNCRDLVIKNYTINNDIEIPALLSPSLYKIDLSSNLPPRTLTQLISREVRKMSLSLEQAKGCTNALIDISSFRKLRKLRLTAEYDYGIKFPISLDSLSISGSITSNNLVKCMNLRKLHVSWCAVTFDIPYIPSLESIHLGYGCYRINLNTLRLIKKLSIKVGVFYDPDSFVTGTYHQTRALMDFIQYCDNLEKLEIEMHSTSGRIVIVSIGTKEKLRKIKIKSNTEYQLFGDCPYINNSENDMMEIDYY
jgi:hypothetical protein